MSSTYSVKLVKNYKKQTNKVSGNGLKGKPLFKKINETLVRKMRVCGI